MRNHDGSSPVPRCDGDDSRTTNSNTVIEKEIEAAIDEYEGEELLEQEEAENTPEWDGSESELVLDDEAAVYEEPYTGIKFEYSLKKEEIMSLLNHYSKDKIVNAETFFLIGLWAKYCLSFGFWMVLLAYVILNVLRVFIKTNREKPIKKGPDTYIRICPFNIAVLGCVSMLFVEPQWWNEINIKTFNIPTSFGIVIIALIAYLVNVIKYKKYSPLTDIYCGISLKAIILVAGWCLFILRDRIDVAIFTCVAVIVVYILEVYARIWFKANKIRKADLISLEIYPDNLVVTQNGKERKIELDGSSKYEELKNMILIYPPKGQIVCIPMRCIEPDLVADIEAMIISGTTPKNQDKVVWYNK